MKKHTKNSPPISHLLQAQQAPAPPYAKVVNCPGTGSYPAPPPSPTTHFMECVQKFTSSPFIVSNIEALHVLNSCLALCPRVSSFLLALWSPRLGKKELLMHLFLCFARVSFCPFSLPLGVGGWLRFLIVALPAPFYLLFCSFSKEGEVFSIVLLCFFLNINLLILVIILLFSFISLCCFLFSR